MRILGIDPGSLVTGWGVVERAGAGRLVHVRHGQIETGAQRPLSERLLAVSEGLRAVIEEHRPEAVSVESVFHAKNVRSAVMLGHARGVALLSAAGFGLPVYEYAPMAVKKAVTGYGAATKDQVQKMVRALLGAMDAAGPDASDALAMAICHIHHCGPASAARPSAERRAGQNAR